MFEYQGQQFTLEDILAKANEANITLPELLQKNPDLKKIDAKPLSNTDPKEFLEDTAIAAAISAAPGTTSFGFKAAKSTFELLKGVPELFKGAKETVIKQALNLFGCFRLSARIYNLRQEGHDIIKRTITSDHGDKHFAEYTLLKLKGKK